jgi:AcrR family transcriptional regulator
MAPARRNPDADSASRDAQLDAAEAVMLEEGYAAVTSRHVAGRAGVNHALVYYYFGSMDALFLAVFRRRADWMLEQQAKALASEQPLWALWDVTNRGADSALNFEFMALGNHREVVKAELIRYSGKFRELQLAAVSDLLAGYGVDAEEWPPAAVIVLLAAVSRFLVMEDSYGLGLGHVETVRIVERFLTRLEGERRPAEGTDPAR